MKTKSLVELTPIQVDKIRRLADEKRRTLGFAGNIPIANDIFTILDKLGIYLLEYPIKSEDSRPAFSAALMCASENESENDLAFIGLNTSDYLDKQIFAIAHELYHYFTKTGSHHLSRLFEEECTIIEAEANRFAAEFLLPETELISIVIKEFKAETLVHLKNRTLLRFIARLYCTWWLPYRSIVKRLYEISAINSDQYKFLYQLDERDTNAEFSKICNAINKAEFNRLNLRTKNKGTSPNYIEIILRNYEDGIISEDKFVMTLSLFGKNPEEFGYDFKIPEEDLIDLQSFFSEANDNEG